ncbi:hypothetical protein BC830DRAFT_1153024, partial [Chytriomyces sp. MP71]
WLFSFFRGLHDFSWVARPSLLLSPSLQNKASTPKMTTDNVMFDESPARSSPTANGLWVFVPFDQRPTPSAPPSPPQHMGPLPVHPYTSTPIRKSPSPSPTSASPSFRAGDISDDERRRYHNAMKKHEHKMKQHMQKLHMHADKIKMYADKLAGEPPASRVVAQIELSEEARRAVAEKRRRQHEQRMSTYYHVDENGAISLPGSSGSPGSPK